MPRSVRHKDSLPSELTHFPSRRAILSPQLASGQARGGFDSGLVRVSSALHPPGGLQKSPTEQLPQGQCHQPIPQAAPECPLEVGLRPPSGALSRPASLPRASPFSLVSLPSEPWDTLFLLPRGALPSVSNEQVLQSVVLA